MMVDPWPLKPLSDVAEIIMGQAPPGSDCNKLGEGTPFVKVSHFSNTTPEISEWTTNPRKMASKSDVLICVVGNCGELNLGLECAIGRSVAAIRPIESLLSQKYLYYFLHQMIPAFRKISQGTAQKVLRKNQLQNLEIPFPPLEEQRRIVSILDEAFAKIKQSANRVQTKLDDVNDLLQSVFSAITEDSSTWENKTVEELLFSEKGSIRTGPFGSQLLHSEFVDEGIAVLGIDNAVNNEFRWGKRRFITEEKYSQLSRYTVKPGDVIITIMGTCGRCAIIPDDIPTAINTKHLCCITLDTNKCLPEYLHAYFLHHPLSLEYLKKMAKGSVMDGLNMGIIRKLPVLLPTKSEQREIIEKLNMVSNEIKKLEDTYQTELESLTELEQSMLQEAFTGKLTGGITA